MRRNSSTTITAETLTLERSIIGRVGTVVHSIRLWRGEMLEQMNIAARNHLPVPTRQTVIFNGDRKVSGSEKLLTTVHQGDSLNDTTIWKAKRHQLSIGCRAVRNECKSTHAYHCHQ